ADDADRRIRCRSRRRECRVQSFDDVTAQIETALLLTRRTPVDNEDPQARIGQMPKKAVLRQEVENVIPVDQRRDDQNGGTDATSIIEQPRRTPAPHNRWRGAAPAEGMSA